ncbi:MAG: vacuolar protein sorting-associated family 26 protein [archaeon]|nr:vacuolar protein sorting-associated family 26 protein [archaeon]
MDSPGVIFTEKKSYDFKFQQVNMNYESFKGDYIEVKYYILVKILASLRDITHEAEFTVINPEEESVLLNDKETINLCVGIHDMLKISIDFAHKHYYYHGLMEGTITFLQVGMPLTFMELQIIKRENLEKQDENPPACMAKFELMDGSPVRNEKIPIRLFLKPYDLTPTYESINNQFSVKYYINLVLEDNEENRFFKQKEVIFHRIKKVRKASDEEGLLFKEGLEKEKEKEETPLKEEIKEEGEEKKEEIKEEEKKEDIPQSDSVEDKLDG